MAVQRAAATFHLATSEGWRTIAAGAELADDDLAVTTAPQYFVPVEPVPVEAGPKTPTKRATTRSKSSR